jgi:undecaprenyl pyrophosphate phosphatase UppP
VLGVVYVARYLGASFVPHGVTEGFGVAAAVVALLSTRFLMGYFRVNNLKWLAVCSAILGVAGLVLVH